MLRLLSQKHRWAALVGSNEVAQAGSAERDGCTVQAVGGSCCRPEAPSLEKGSLLSGKAYEAGSQEARARLSHVTPLLPGLVSHSPSLSLSFPIYKESTGLAMGDTGGGARGLLSQDLPGKMGSSEDNLRLSWEQRIHFRSNAPTRSCQEGTTGEIRKVRAE